MLQTNIYRNRIDGRVIIGETEVANITGYLFELNEDRGSVAIVIYDKESYKQNFEEINKDLNEFFLFYQKEQIRLFTKEENQKVRESDVILPGDNTDN